MENEDEQIGVNIVRKALEVPMRKIAENAGKDGSVIVENVRQAQAKRRTSRSATMSSQTNMLIWSRAA